MEFRLRNDFDFAFFFGLNRVFYGLAFGKAEFAEGGAGASFGYFRYEEK